LREPFGTIMIEYNTIIKERNFRGSTNMESTIEYESINIGVINHNLSSSGEPSSANSLNSPSGFLAELYLASRIETQSNLVNSKWHIHYRE
jgi:hypothetical protein